MAAAVPPVVDFPPALFLPPAPPAIVRAWHLENAGDVVGVPDADVDAESAWTVTLGDRTIIVAIIDSGVDVLHPLLAGAIVVNGAETPANGLDDDGNGYPDDVTGWDFADGDADVLDVPGIVHGTLVAGLVASADHGIAPGVGLLPVKIFSSTGVETDFEQAAADGILYALDRGARVLQISWDIGQVPPGPVLQAAFDAADAAGALIVVAAGNDGEDLDVTPRYPASLALPSVVTVAGSDRYDRPVDLAGLFVTNRGAATVELAAPTEKVLTTFPGGGTLLFSGTSASAPIVSGIAALTWSANPALTAAEVRACLLQGVDVLPQLDGIVSTSGRVNAANSVRCASPPVAALRPVRSGEPDRPILYDATASLSFTPSTFAAWWFADGDTASSASLTAEHRFDTGGAWPVTVEVIATNGTRSVARTETTIPFRWIPTASSVQSAHPYAANTQLVTSVSIPGARWIRLHFTQVETAGNDTLLLYDGERDGLVSYQGAFTDLTTAPIRGDTAFIYLRGFTGGVHGFTLDRIDAQFDGDTNHTPTARASGSVAARVNAPATLTAEDSTDPDGDALTFAWRLLSKPESSTATLSSTTGPDTSLTPDTEGDYGVTLTATDLEGATHSTIAWIVTRPHDGSGCSITRANRPIPFALALLAALTLLRRSRSRTAPLARRRA